MDQPHRPLGILQGTFASCGNAILQQNRGHAMLGEKIADLHALVLVGQDLVTAPRADQHRGSIGLFGLEDGDLRHAHTGQSDHAIGWITLHFALFTNLVGRFCGHTRGPEVEHQRLRCDRRGRSQPHHTEHSPSRPDPGSCCTHARSLPCGASQRHIPVAANKRFRSAVPNGSCSESRAPTHDLPS